MGACKSRQTKSSHATKTMDAPLLDATMTKPKPQFRLRADAQPYLPTVPADEEPEVKEPWERFLDGKQRDQFTMRKGQLRRQQDGSYTAEYRNLLVKPARGASPSRPWARSRSPGGEFDLRDNWRAVQASKRAASPGPKKDAEAKKRKPTALKKAILAERDGNGNPSVLWQQFDAHLQKVNLSTEKVDADAQVKDDFAVPSSRVPFGLSDRCYLTDREDVGKAQRHREASHAVIREYVPGELTPGLEAAVTEVLFALRQLRIAELGTGQKSRRYAVGFREVARLIAKEGLKCLVVAPNVERSDALEGKIRALVQACEAQHVPVVYALSRRQLGAAIQKNVTVSVLAIQDARGCQALFDKMMEQARLARLQ